MFRKCAARTYYALLLTLAHLLLGCSWQEEPIETTDAADDFVKAEEVVVLSTDSDEWRVRLFREHLLYSEAAVQLPAPWVIPSREEAQVLKKCNYPNGERFVTSDGYTFAMPSSSVSKAGSKTRYAVLGLQIRKTVIDIGF